MRPPLRPKSSAAAVFPPTRFTYFGFCVATTWFEQCFGTRLIGTCQYGSDAGSLGTLALARPRIISLLGEMPCASCGILRTCPRRFYALTWARRQATDVRPQRRNPAQRTRPAHCVQSPPRRQVPHFFAVWATRTRTAHNCAPGATSGAARYRTTRHKVFGCHITRKLCVCRAAA